MEYKDTPWKDILIDTRDYTVYRDKYPVTEGHILFVPKEQTFEAIQKCYKAAYGWGYEWKEKGYCDAYNIGQNVGTEAGQTIPYPHIHLIPRRKGDMEDPFLDRLKQMQSMINPMDVGLSQFALSLHRKYNGKPLLTRPQHYFHRKEIILDKLNNTKVYCMEIA